MKPNQSAMSLKEALNNGAVCLAGVAGAVSRTATAPVDRMKLLLQVDSTARGLTVREGWNRMAAEGKGPFMPLTTLSKARS